MGGKSPIEDDDPEEAMKQERDNMLEQRANEARIRARTAAMPYPAGYKQAQVTAEPLRTVTTIRKSSQGEW